MNNEKELTGNESNEYEKGRTGGLDLDPFKTDSEEAARERGEEDRINAEQTQKENEDSEA